MKMTPKDYKHFKKWARGCPFRNMHYAVSLWWLIYRPQVSFN